MPGLPLARAPALCRCERLRRGSPRRRRRYPGAVSERAAGQPTGGDSSGTVSAGGDSSGRVATGGVATSAADEALVRRAIELAHAAAAWGDVPVGAVMTDAAGEPFAEASNERELTGDPTAHAEVLALRRAAAARGTWNLEGTTLAVSLEPCVMCAGAIAQARVSRVVFGAWDDKSGAAGSLYDVLRDRRMPYRAEVVGGVLATEAAAPLEQFFADRRGI